MRGPIVKANTTNHTGTIVSPEIPLTGFVRAKQIHQFFGIGLSTWWLWVKEGKAPPGIRLGSRTTVWRAEDVRALLDELSREA
ncbi:AlpA family phage regulatory protein [Seongchinamella unica]|uniref:AlpA family phage regulatory protein n=1 Tax=Seongchinamella unica TaxID=2547392 RepID=A0A4R5LX98_9GAMM|nr:AlpA family phage regulatory protein [Seongchinamella unica]